MPPTRSAAADASCCESTMSPAVTSCVPPLPANRAAVSASSLPIPDPAFPNKTAVDCSSLSSPPRERREPGWDCGCRKASWSSTAEPCECEAAPVVATAALSFPSTCPPRRLPLIRQKRLRVFRSATRHFGNSAVRAVSCLNLAASKHLSSRRLFMKRILCGGILLFPVSAFAQQAPYGSPPRTTPPTFPSDQAPRVPRSDQQPQFPPDVAPPQTSSEERRVGK